MFHQEIYDTKHSDKETFTLSQKRLKCQNDHIAKQQCMCAVDNTLCYEAVIDNTSITWHCVYPLTKLKV